MDTLGIENAVMAGFDSIARTTNFVAALWPRHCKALVSECGFLIGSQELETTWLRPNAGYQWQYQYYFGIERGAAGCDRYAHDFARLTWELVSLPWEFHNTTFAQSASALDNPDHVAITIHNYRRSPGLAHGKTKSDCIERKLAAFSGIAVPTITIEGVADGAPHPDPSACARRFAERDEHRLLTVAIGHNPPRASPGESARAVIDADRFLARRMLQFQFRRAGSTSSHQQGRARSVECVEYRQEPARRYLFTGTRRRHEPSRQYRGPPPD
ncbi:alpha/beta hydrolase [Sphingomonas sp. MMSM24]|uniref:Alpha/beta hydrolase n=2 Tax=Sphingomonas lycopersici TaxID=2951807 RepID=A0AA41ZBS1_9SPHN|nr:alpha/beta hydrolase [Sphingomonas lycopersici]